MSGLAACAMRVGEASRCEQVAPLQAAPSKVTVPGQLRATGGTAASAASSAALSGLGMYGKLAVGEAGMPGLASRQPKPSAAPVPVHAVHDRSFRPATRTHLPLKHSLSLVQ